MNLQSNQIHVELWTSCVFLCVFFFVHLLCLSPSVNVNDLLAWVGAFAVHQARCKMHAAGMDSTNAY